MSLRLFRQLWKSTGFRLTLWFASVFILSLLLLYALVYLLLARSIQENSRQLALNKLNQYTRIEQTRGLGSLLRELVQDDPVNHQTGFFVRVADGNNQTMFMTTPAGWEDADPGQIADRKFTGESRWLFVQQHPGAEALEIMTLVLTDDVTIQVGFGSGEQRRQLAHFKRIFAVIMLPALLLGVAGGYVFAHWSLRPVRDLTATIRRIDPGNMGVRVPSREAGDELDELVTLFNRMLERIQTLIQGMRAALDNVAHDLRTPLARLRAGVETVLQTDADCSTLREVLQDCAEESELIVNMLNVLMDISEAETGVMALHFELTDVTALLADVTELYRYVAEEKAISIALKAPPSLEASVDPRRLRQVVANLLDNAVKYTPKGGQVELAAMHAGDGFAIEVRDTGTGIPDADMPFIFDRLYRGDKSRSQRGLGLGLSLVKAVVQAHGGEIAVKNLPEHGACFTIELPQGLAA